MEKAQFKLTILPQLDSRLRRLAAGCGYENANEFWANALDQYAELITELVKEQLDQMALIRKRQREQLLGKNSQEPSLRRR